MVLAYHDQGHIAIKVHNFHQSTTANWEVVRTSVDHGTAFDIAGTGSADLTGLLAAVEAAEALWMAFNLVVWRGFSGRCQCFCK